MCEDCTVLLDTSNQKSQNYGVNNKKNSHQLVSFSNFIVNKRPIPYLNNSLIYPVTRSKIVKQISKMETNKLCDDNCLFHRT